MRTYVVAAAILVSGILAYLLFSEGDSQAPATRSENASTQSPTHELADSLVQPRRMRAPIRASADGDAGPGVPPRTHAAGTLGDRNARRAEMFATFDADGDGLLDDEERDALRASRAQRRQARQLDFFDTNEDGVLDDDERAMQQQERSEMRAERVRTVLSETDSDADGNISPSEAASSDRRMQTLLRDFEGVDTDSDGLVSSGELQAAMIARRDKRRAQRRGELPAGEDAP